MKNHEILKVKNNAQKKTKDNEAIHDKNCFD